jgi:diaminopropionate ammonia-lyase
LLRNPAGPGPSAEIREASSYSKADADRAYARISAWPDYSVTPLHELGGLARTLGVASVLCKDESRRLGLHSFKALGAVYASVVKMSELLAARLARKIDDRDLMSGKYAAELKDYFLICCTDGNHGFSVASAARRMGMRAVIYIPSGVSEGRAAALAREGAEVVRIDGIYDEAYAAVEEVARKDPGAIIISDSATAEYREIPTLCMMGYSVMAREIVAQCGDAPPTHVMLPAGCGGMAAAMISAFHHFLGERAPKAIVAEPSTAACLYESARAGSPVVVGGDLETLMGGLSCAAVSHVAWPTLTRGVTAFLTMEDDAAVAAMRAFAEPAPGDPRIVSGETGAAGLAAAMVICGDGEARGLAGIDARSRILVINCEGATDPEAYERLTGHQPG